MINRYVDILNDYVYNCNGKDVNRMPVSEQIKILCIKNKISVSKLAQILGTSPQAFSQKLKRESMTIDD